MDNIKLSLSVVLPGSVMFSKEESFKPLKSVVRTKNGKILKKKGQAVYKTVLKPDFDKHTRETLIVRESPTSKEETLTVLCRSCKPARQVINLSEEAYTYMISKEKPETFRGDWNSLSITQKLRWHCFRIAESLGGTLDSFQVMD